MKKLYTFLFFLVSAGCFHCHSRFIAGERLDTVRRYTGRAMRYMPERGDFVILNGQKRFNRALYGTNTGFRAEAGDLPEFALYMPGMGGNLKFGLVSADSGKWLTDAEYIKAGYRPGSMLYEIRDDFLGDGTLRLTVIAMSDAEGVILKMTADNLNRNCSICWVFGGATGKRFSREGDIGADPESVFYLKPEYCADNEYFIQDNLFRLYYGSGRARSEDELYENNHQLSVTEKEALRLKRKKRLNGLVPVGSSLKICDAGSQDSPTDLIRSDKSASPVIAGIRNMKQDDAFYYIIWNPLTRDTLRYEDARSLFDEAENARKELAERIRINTPDPFINTMGGALSIAADAIWEEPSYLHGAVAWRMRLPGWRGAYAADWLGWHDRARMHFDAYLKAQYTAPDSGPNVPDPKTNFARQEEKAGNSIFTSGYISRHPGRISGPHHYDMNLVFFDQLLRHLKWTGDTAYARKIWPALKRHLAWEKRCFDGNRDGLYDAYCCIWASDALHYSGGGTTHSSAYNCHANRMAGKIAEMTGDDPGPFVKEAEKIHHALDSMLWMPDKGWYAEYKDLLGLKKVHPSAALWTIYHAIDSDVPDAFQAYQALKYIDHEIPRIPVFTVDLPQEKYRGYYVLSSTSWMPYTWSINNVSMAENLHTALAYWQGGRKEEAYTLWKSSLLESMYLGSSPGNFQQLSSHDAFRGELYRDFADAVGIAARTLVEGLFGIIPDALNNTLTICPGFPGDWDFASLAVPDISIDYQREETTDRYIIKPSFPQKMNLRLKINARGEYIESIRINGKAGEWRVVTEAVDNPQIEVPAEFSPEWIISVTWKGALPGKLSVPGSMAFSRNMEITADDATFLQIYDPQNILKNAGIKQHHFVSGFNQVTGHKTFFMHLSQGILSWWEPVCVELEDPVEIIAGLQQEQNTLSFQIKNNTDRSIMARFTVNPGVNSYIGEKEIPPAGISPVIHVPMANLIPGSNLVQVEAEDIIYKKCIVNWQVSARQDMHYETIDLTGCFNDKVINIFKNRYLSPRSPYPTLQIPLQGIGDWCSYNKTAEIDDSGLRRIAGDESRFYLPAGIPFATPGNADSPNILFTGLWDNYPDKAIIPLAGKASHIYLLLAGSTHHMQSRFVNGMITIVYTDGTSEKLELKNPENWWPVEQDYHIDGLAFSVDAARPLRVYLKTGEAKPEPYNVLAKNKTIHIEGGAASVLDMPVDLTKELMELRLEATANDVVIGLMGITVTVDK
ncbi:MAG: DUF4450 domain-containing protein [Bacteroidales bacterium]|nr:DUF4450 domain-containing protein [Bacteroidales bacterium]